MKKLFVFGLVIVSCILVIYTLGCGQSATTATTTTTVTTSTTTTTIAQISLAYITGNNKAIAYGGTRASASSISKQDLTYTVTGTIYNSYNNNPLPGAYVQFGTTSTATLSAADGSYSLANVPAGNVFFTAGTTYDANYTNNYVSVKTNAQKIDFYLARVLNAALYVTGEVSGTVTNESGTAVESAKIAISSNIGIGTMGYSNISTNASGAYISPSYGIYAGTIYVGAGKTGSGSGVSSGITMSGGQSKTIDIKLLKQATLEMSIASAPSGYNLEVLGSPFYKIINSTTPVSLPSYETDSQAQVFRVQVPTGIYAIYASYASPDLRYHSGAADFNVTAETGAKTSKSMTFYAPPTNLQFSCITSETVGYISTITWEAPSGWTPDVYYVHGTLGLGLSLYGYWYGFTDATSISVPLELKNNEYIQVYAVKLTEPLDLSSINIDNLHYSQWSGIANH